MMNVKAHGNEENDDIDRISSLPDEICTHIVSFLTTKEAVQTCILSKRWINTWASVPDLKFDIEEFGVPSIGVPWAKDSADKMAVEFVTKFELLLRNVLEKRETSCVNRFQLWLDSDIYLPWTRALVDCIADVMKLGPRECFVEMGLCKNLNLNTDVIFTCASLIHLQLYFYIELDVFVAIEPNSVNLPCLKTLNLVGVTMSDDSLKKLLLGCPLLEELVLEDCNINIIEICSNTLKKLFILSYVMKLQISTPNLLYLDIEVKPKGKTLVLNMPSLVDASICIRGWFDQDNYITRESELIHSLSHVKSLRLDYVWYKLPKVLKKDFYDCPVFNNLKRLELVNMTLYDFDRASFFLHYSPKLQELTVSKIRAQKSKFLELTNEGPRDALVLPEVLRREFLKTVIISGDYRVVDQLINKLLTYVKMIGEIRTSTRTLYMVTWGRLHS